MTMGKEAADPGSDSWNVLTYCQDADGRKLGPARNDHIDVGKTMAFRPAKAAFRLTAAQTAERSAIVSGLEEQAIKLSEAVDEANKVIEQTVETVNAQIEAYNEVLADARRFASAVAQRARDEIAKASERWQASRRGEAASAWASEWEDADLSEVELASIGPVEELETDHAIILDELPDSIRESE
jgi:hypothetical protein